AGTGSGLGFDFFSTVTTRALSSVTSTAAEADTTCSSVSPSGEVAAMSVAFTTWDSLRMSMRQPVSLAAKRTFWPDLPMASDNILSGTTTNALLASSLTVTLTALAGDSASAINCAVSGDQRTMSIFSSYSSFTTACTREPRWPTQLPTGSTF